MRGIARCIGVTLAVIGMLALATPGYADTVEQRLDELARKVAELQETVNRQNARIAQQEEIIQGLTAGIVSPEEVDAAAMAPHLDKHLLHERSGLGEQLGAIRIGLGLTGIVQGSIGADDASEDGGDHTDGSWSMDLEFEAPIGENGLTFLGIEAGQGEGLTDELAMFYHGANADAGESEGGLEVTEAWYEHTLLDGRGSLTIGKIDVTNYVDGNAVANDETLQFLNDALVNSIAVEFPEDNGAGVRLSVRPADWVELTLAWAESDADWEDIFKDGFGVAEVNFMPMLLDREGNYRVYVWANGSDKELLDGADTDEKGWGLGLSFDQNLNDWLTAFVRVGCADDDVYEAEAAWSAGANISGALWSRENDVLGIAVSQAFLNDELEDDDTETLFEAYYNIALNDRLKISPDIQVVDNPGGSSDNDTVVVIGSRAQVDF